MTNIGKSSASDTTPGSTPRSRERRREPRIEVSIEIEVSAIDHFGKPFREVARTIEVSEWGCSFRLAAQLDVDALAALSLTCNQPYCFPDAHPVMFQVNYSKQESGTWIVGASKMQPERLWDTDAMCALPKASLEAQRAPHWFDEQQAGAAGNTTEPRND